MYDHMILERQLLLNTRLNRLRWFEHVQRMEENKTPERVSYIKPSRQVSNPADPLATEQNTDGCPALVDQKPASGAAYRRAGQQSEDSCYTDHDKNFGSHILCHVCGT